MEPRLPLVGMAKERKRLSRALGDREPLLVLGARGSGKTRLIEEVLCGHPDALYVPWEPTLHALLTAMARTLIGVRHADFLRRAGTGANPQAWLLAQTSVHLKGLL